MNNRLLANLSAATLSLILSINAVNAQTVPDSIVNKQIEDSLANNKNYQKLIKRAELNEPSLQYFKNQIKQTNAKIEDLKQGYFAETLKSLNRKSKLGNFFTPKQIEQINQELNTFGENIKLTKDSTLYDLRTVLIKYQIPANQLPLNGKAVVKSKYTQYDLRTFGTWEFVDFDINNQYLHCEHILKNIHDIPKTSAFLELSATLYRYKEQYEKLSLAKQRAIILKNAITDYFHKSK